MHSAHTFDIKSTKSQSICNGGSRTIANSDNFPILRGMATYSLKLDRGGIREPHWHPNAAELSYCLSGKALMTIFGHGATHNTFTIERDEIAFVPQGFLHHIENISEEELHFAVFFSHEKPQDIGISGAFGAYSNEVFGAVFNVDPKVFESLPKYQKDLFVVAGGG